MYIVPTMIDMGLKEGQDFPSDAHKEVAMNIGLCNPSVVNRDTLTEIVQAVISIPQDKIKGVTFEDLILKYNCPGIGY